MNTYVYSIEDDPEEAKTLYVNLTNKCSNACVFCIRNTAKKIKGENLWLETEEFESADVISQLNKFNKYEEVVFCGYGEPFFKFEVLKEVAEFLKQNGKKVRINTNGIGNFVNKKDVLSELVSLVDEISISLNASTEEQYNQISKPKYKEAYAEMISFAEQSVKLGIKTTLSVVDGYPDYKLDLETCKKIADNIGASFRVREWLNNGY